MVVQDELYRTYGLRKPLHNINSPKFTVISERDSARHQASQQKVHQATILLIQLGVVTGRCQKPTFSSLFYTLNCTQFALMSKTDTETPKIYMSYPTLPSLLVAILHHKTLQIPPVHKLTF